MDLAEFNSSAGFPTRKPWLNPVCNTIECQDATVHGRITQESGHPTPYALWASLNDFPLVASGVSTYAMGTFVGPASVPGTSLYPGASFRCKVGGTITTTVANNVILSIRDLAGAYTFASVEFKVGGAIAATPFSAEFDIQINATGGPGVGSMRSASAGQLGSGATAIVSSFNIEDAATFDSTGGVAFHLYMSNSAPGNSINRTLGYCTALY